MTDETATEKRLRELAYIASVDGRSDLQPEDEEHLNIARKAFALLRDDKNKFRSPVRWEQDRQLLLARASDLQRDKHDVSGTMPELQRDADRASETVADAGVHSAGEDAGRRAANIVRREGDGMTNMSDVERLRDWARNIETHGGQISHWSAPSFVVKELRRIADDIDEATYQFMGERPPAAQTTLPLANGQTLHHLVTAHAQAVRHRCAGCGYGWDGRLVGPELCGDCWRKIRPLLHWTPEAPSTVLPTTRPRVEVGDVVRIAGFGLREIPNQQTAELLFSNDGVDAIFRCVWRREQAS